MAVCSVASLFEDNMSNNMQLWDSVCMTDPRAVKQITGKTYKGNSPKPYWLIEQATRRFGPIGIGWGVTVKSERFERVTDTDVLHVATVSVWYVLDGKRSETFDQMGGTKAAYQSRNGMVVDEDAGKKSVTDGMVKCLSMIGFAGDIFAGRWDDSKYVEHAAAEWDRRIAEDSMTDEERAAREAEEKRQNELTDLAMFLIDCHQNDKDLDAIRVFYDPKTWSADNPTATEEQKHVWALLKNESKLRGVLKANSPHLKAA
jgi:hypothetical protein